MKNRNKGWWQEQPIELARQMFREASKDSTISNSKALLGTAATLLVAVSVSLYVRTTEGPNRASGA